jgi:alpha-tubulin suppressor-like RCC1 family protein/O-glycosyl hydrolase
MTESAAYVIKSSASRTQILEALFGSPPYGAGLSIVRFPIGPSDFTVTKHYPTTYSKTQAEEYLMPMLTAAKAAAAPRALKLLATPWSAPGGMKIGKKLIGSGLCEGSNDYLEKNKYSAYAQYLTKAVHDYQQAGLPISTLSLQNEPHNCNTTYPTMKMEPSDEAEFSRTLYAQLRATRSGISVPPRLLGWDHNWNDYNNEPANKECPKQGPTSFPESLFKLENRVEALGYHGYCGEPRTPMGVPRSLPFYLTEATGITQSPYTAQNLPYEVQHYLIDPLRVGAKGSLYWNLALNPQCGPQWGGIASCKKPKASTYGGCIDCRPLITANADGTFTLNQDYYYWAQLSEFMQPGAHVIATSTTGELDSVAVANPDGTIALAVLNGASLAQQRTTATGIAASYSHSCAVTAAARVWCWGGNTDGELGDGTTETRLTPVEVAGTGPVSAVTTSESDSCALLDSGGIDCWGSNLSGQLGNKTENPSLVPTPADITEAVGVADGVAHTCALMANGTVECWGANDDGQVGPTKITTRGYPEVTYPVPVAGIEHATAIAAAGNYSCALKLEGTVYCWGNNANGELGDGTMETTGTPVPVSGITDAVAIAAGESHACAVLRGGRVACWGSNGNGQLGNGTTTGSTVPVEVLGIESARTVTAGTAHSCATLTNGTVDCWGAGGNGQLGNGESGGEAQSTIPVQVAGLAEAQAVAAGSWHTCTVLERGAARCWGADWTGQLGDGLTEQSPIAVEVTGFP